MIDRYCISPEADELALVFGVEVPTNYSPVYNAAPTHSLPIITFDKQFNMSCCTWGILSSWSNNKKLGQKFFNVDIADCQAESNHNEELLSKKCIVPMDGFFLWKQLSNKKSVPYYFHFQDKRIFACAGIWEATEDGFQAFRLMIKDADSDLQSIQGKMPLIFSPNTAKEWLKSGNMHDLEEITDDDFRNDLEWYSCNPKVSDPNLNTPDVTLPASLPDQGSTYTLFG
ncbi:MAG: DUF2461 family protein [Bacteroidota bacterium]